MRRGLLPGEGDPSRGNVRNAPAFAKLWPRAERVTRWQ
jgi:hypothetical protein